MLRTLLGKAEKGQAEEGQGGDVRRMVLVLATTAMAAMAIVGLVLSGDGLLTYHHQADAQTASRPNFVVVMTDDLDEQSVEQLAGIRQVMGSNGTTFENAYVAYSLCCPSRATFFRGQYPHNHGITSGTDAEGEPRFRQLGRDKSTISTWLNNAGYQTKYLGKYLNGYRGPYIPPGWDEWFALHGGQVDNKVNDDGQLISLTGNSTDAFAAEASEFIRRSSAKSDPFFVMVGTRAPHAPPEVPQRYQNGFADAQLPNSPNFDEVDVSDKPQWVRSYPRITQDQINTAQNDYRQRLRSMLVVEDLLSQVVAMLQQTNELDNTYIIFTSDNGFHLGNHRLLPGDKKTPYEEDIGVPLMVRGPGVPAAAERQQMVLNTDLAPTIAELAGVSTPSFVDGSSFAPLLTTTPPSSWREAFLQEGWPASKTLVPTHKSVHTQKYMFTEYDTGEYELYDLSVDPYQLESKPRAGNEQLYDELQARLTSLRNCSGANCRTAEGFGTTTPPDTTAPTVTSTVPTANATGIVTTANVTATFSEDMDASSINVNTFKLTKKGSTTKIAAVVKYFPDDRSTATFDPRATLDPNNSLQRGATYKAVVSPGAMDLAGNSLDQNSATTGSQQMAWFFTVS